MKFLCFCISIAIWLLIGYALFMIDFVLCFLYVVITMIGFFFVL